MDNFKNYRKLFKFQQNKIQFTSLQNENWFSRKSTKFNNTDSRDYFSFLDFIKMWKRTRTYSLKKIFSWKTYNKVTNYVSLNLESYCSLWFPKNPQIYKFTRNSPQTLAKYKISKCKIDWLFFSSLFIITGNKYKMNSIKIS